ncbi:DNA polymerase III subunit alpha [Chamaesiphon sp. VAR_48_metabat_135_sub]|uniref:DNA polymerase III subunit alpha n=1 Tax=Chamaesiphon sp. VAR_48_metabat_135_sub TaxID=2964699 RepID=UPI00286C57A5|nr:DNA polymerase III subunit alpha [Chamaesiphon sp. VAR_48_metabat_135_sub]
MTFVGLHMHSDYSLLDGASQLPNLVDRAVELGMPAIALTDHGVMYGAIELIKVCRARNVKPIIGNEMYVINGDFTQQKRYQKFHQVVLAKNTQGYRNLVKLTTVSHLEGFQGRGIFARPCINKEYIEKYKEGLIITSGCLGGEVPQAIMAGRPDAARKVARWYKERFGEDYYLEIQDHGLKEDRVVNVEIVRIARELDIKLIATNDSHFVSCFDVEAHDALLCIQTGQLIREDKRMRYSGNEYLKSAEEMAQLFRDHLPDDVIAESIANTLEVADKIQPYNILGELNFPDFPIPVGHTSATYVEEISRAGLQERLQVKRYTDIDKEYQDRLDFELKMIDRMGFSTYFLVVWDYIKFARDRAIPVGPGRGSAAGSLVAYAMKITNIDPVHHCLLFERFLNPDRKSMPDIDTDFCIERRSEVIDYVTEKYGKERVAQIITFNRMTSKAVLKDVARVLNIPYAVANEMGKLIPVARGKPAKLAVMISDKTPSPEFKQAYETDEYADPETGEKISARQWIDMAMRIEGTNKTFGVHAAGVVISSQPLDEIVPLQRNNDGSVITQYYMEDLDSMGLIKMDFLGLRNLTIIQNAIDLIEQTKGDKIDPDDITREERRTYKILSKGTANKRPPNVQKTYKQVESGDLEGVFQLESSGMLDVVARLKPSSIEDLSSILALYRPGPLDAGLIPIFIDRKHGREKISYEHPILEPILNETYGVIVYQEQIMKIAQDLAGYTLGEADILRRCMGKKKADEMNKQREKFLDGAAKKGVEHSIADALFDKMVLFAEYCFNKSHSTAYAYVTYQTAFLKANYPAEYMSALLTANSGDQDKMTRYLNNCEQTLDIKVEPPDINRSYVKFRPVIDPNRPNRLNILFGLSAIRNVGEAAIENILTAREEGGEFLSLADVCQRVSLQSVNKRTLESLIQCGAFDNIDRNRRQLINDLEVIIPWSQSKAKEKAIGQGNLFDLFGDSKPEIGGFEATPKSPIVSDFSSQERLQFEQDLLGIYVSDHPLKNAERIAKMQKHDFKRLVEIDKPCKDVKIVVMLTEVKVVQTKKENKSMAILKLTDLAGSKLEAVVFPEAYEKNKNVLVGNASVILVGKVSKKKDEDELQMIVDEAIAIDYNFVNKPVNLVTEPKHLVLIELPINVATDDIQTQQLKTMLEEYSGDTLEIKTPVYAIVRGENGYQLVQFGKQFWVQDPAGLVDRMQDRGFDIKVKEIESVDGEY